MSCIATTEEHRILLHGKEVVLEHCASHAIIGSEPADREGLLKLIDTILATEIEPPEPNDMALSFTCAALDIEARIREERDNHLQSLCAQVEVYLGRTPLPQI